MPILTITVADLRRLAGIDADDTGQDAALEAVRDAEQIVIEYGLDPAILAAALTDAGLNATLALGVAEILAGRYLEQTARAPGALDDLKAGPLTLTAGRAPGPAALAQELARHGAARLAPYGKTPGVPSASDLPASPPSVGLAGTGAAPGECGWEGLP